MTQSNMPAHNHALLASSQNGESMNPQGAAARGLRHVVAAHGRLLQLRREHHAQRAGSLGSAGSNQPFSIIQPSLALNYIIAVEGIYPSRS
jgi:microcystin-dependent protein